MRPRGTTRRLLTDGGQTPTEDEVYCTSCGEIIQAHAEICTECGVRQFDDAGSGERIGPPSGGDSSGAGPMNAIPMEKSSGTAVLLSFLFPGLGQVYLEEYGKAAAYIVTGVVSILLMLVLVGFVTYPIVWLISLVDAATYSKDS